MNSAKCVVVLWSKKSIVSHYVREEAAEGFRREILIPAIIEEVTLPFGYTRLHTANLSDWKGDSAHLELQELLNAVRAHLGVERRAPDPLREKLQKHFDAVDDNRRKFEEAQLPPEKSLRVQQREHSRTFFTKRLSLTVGAMMLALVVLYSAHQYQAIKQAQVEQALKEAEAMKQAQLEQARKEAEQAQQALAEQAKKQADAEQARKAAEVAKAKEEFDSLRANKQIH